MENHGDQGARHQYFLHHNIPRLLTVSVWRFCENKLRLAPAALCRVGLSWRTQNGGTKDVRLCTYSRGIRLFFATVIARTLDTKIIKHPYFDRMIALEFGLFLGFTNSGGINILLNIFNFPRLHKCVQIIMLGRMGLMLYS